ncbi:MAG: hypothetical protein JRI22_20410 [Deltaproteobacteria bacterium]|nr:hypothetical protein [Deltaproteobacteria bacterium]
MKGFIGNGANFEKSFRKETTTSGIKLCAVWTANPVRGALSSAGRGLTKAFHFTQKIEIRAIMNNHLKVI